MNRVRVAATGGLTVVAAAVVTVGLLTVGHAPAEQPTSRPAGQVEQVEESTTTPDLTTTTTTTVPPADTPPQDPPPQDPPAGDQPPAAEGGDTGGMSQPAPESPDVAPGNPLGDYEERPSPAPIPRSQEEQLPPPPVVPESLQPPADVQPQP